MNVEKEHLNVEKKSMKFKVDILHQIFQLVKEGLSQDDIDSELPIVHDSSSILIQLLP